MNLLNYILGIPAVYAQVADKNQDVGTQTGNELAKFIASFLASIPLWIAAIVIAFASYLVAIAMKRSIELKLSKEGIEEEHREVQIIAGRAAFFGTLTIGITIALSIVGIDLKPIVAAGAFGLGFALQDIIMNLISGVMILASRHFTIGDVITVNGITGKVIEIQTRATIIKDFDGLKVIVPNSELFSNVVVSKTSNPFRKLTFVQGVGYGTDLKKVMELTLAVVNNIPWVLKKPKASVMFTEWDDSWIDFKIKVWIDSKGGKMVKVKNRVMMDLTKAYEDAGIYIPYPIQTIQFENTPKGYTEEETDQPKISKTMDSLKEKYRAKGMSKEQIINRINAPTAATEVQGGQSWLNQAFKQVSNLNNQGPVPAVEAAGTSYNPMPEIYAPATQAPVNSENLVSSTMPTSVNGEGQSWLQNALQNQVQQTQISQVPQQSAPIQYAAAPIAMPAPEQMPVAAMQSPQTSQPYQPEQTQVVYGPPRPPSL